MTDQLQIADRTSVASSPVVEHRSAAELTRRLRASRSGRLALRCAGTLLVLIAWELAVRVGVLPEDDLSPPSTVIPTLVHLCRFEWFWVDVGRTLRSAFVGLVIACAVGIPLGVAFGSIPLLGRAFRPTIEFLRTVPGIALIPALVLGFGINTKTEVFLIAFGCTWPILVQTTYGVMAIDDLALQTARSFGLSRAAQIRHVVLHAVAPYVATGVRICASIALIASVTAGIVVGTHGLGSEISLRQGAGRVDQMYALIVVAGILGVLIQAAFGMLERRLLHWHPSQRAGRER